jgi:hypothetical protein
MQRVSDRIDGLGSCSDNSGDQKNDRSANKPAVDDQRHPHLDLLSERIDSVPTHQVISWPKAKAMKVSVYSANDILLWSREIADGQASGFTSTEYLRDGTQQKIVDALVEALAEARGQLGCFSLQIVDAVSNVGATTTEIDRHVPISIVRDRDASG